MKFESNLYNIKKKIENNVCNYSVSSALSLSLRLKENMPKETKSLVKSVRISAPEIQKNNIITKVIIPKEYAQKQNVEILTHLPQYWIDRNEPMANIARRIKLQKNRKYSQKHKALYNRGLRYLKTGRAGIQPIKTATMFTQKGIEDFIKKDVKSLIQKLAGSLLK